MPIFAMDSSDRQWRSAIAHSSWYSTATAATSLATPGPLGKLLATFVAT
jgi:hypothetical protein